MKGIKLVLGVLGMLVLSFIVFWPVAAFIEWKIFPDEWSHLTRLNYALGSVGMGIVFSMVRALWLTRHEEDSFD